MTPNRRNFLKLSGLVSLGFLGLDKFSVLAASPQFPSLAPDPGFGPLLSNAGGVLDLPKRFRICFMR